MQWKPKLKKCKCCGSLFMAQFPGKMYCSKECNKAFYKTTAAYTLNKNRSNQRDKDKRAKPCAICGKRLDDARKTVHDECIEEVMMNEYPRFSKKTRTYMNNHGYTKEDVEVLIDEREREYKKHNKAV